MPGTVSPMQTLPAIDVVDQRVAFTRRNGGVSGGPFSELNLSDKVGDDPVAVTENRRRVSEAIGIDAGWVTVQQVHGADVHVVGSDAASPETGTVRADAIIATDGRPVAVMVADCVPIAIEGADAYGVIHGGWRSLAAGIVERVAEMMSARRAWIGPAIGACHYEVGDEVIAALGARPLVTLPSGSPGKVRLDLSTTVSQILGSLDVEVVYRSASCTACQADLFSYRRSGVTGRQAVLMWR